MSLNIDRRTEGEIVILDLKGWATLGADSDRLSEFLSGEIHAGTRKLLLNLTQLGHVDSSGIAALMRAYVGMQSSGGVLRLVIPPGRLREMFDVLQLSRALTYLTDEASALASFR